MTHMTSAKHPNYLNSLLAMQTTLRRHKRQNRRSIGFSFITNTAQQRNIQLSSKPASGMNPAAIPQRAALEEHFAGKSARC